LIFNFFFVIFFNETFFSHNKFTCLLDKFEQNNNMDSNSMVKKLLVTANEVSDEIQARSTGDLSYYNN